MKTISLTEEEKNEFIKLLKVNKGWCTSGSDTPGCKSVFSCKKCPLSSQHFFEHLFVHFSKNSLEAMGASAGCMWRARALLVALDDMDKFEILMSI